MDWVDAHRKDLEPATATEENGVGAQPVSEPEAPKEPTKTEREQLMPTEAFEAMADALRPLASGLGDFTVASEVYSCFVDAGDTENCKLTDQGIRRIDELASTAADGARRLDHAVGSMLHRYLPNWCESQLTEVNLLVERIAWILYGAAAAVDTGYSPGSPRCAAVHGYNMARDAYRVLCAKFDDYEAAQKVAREQDYKDRGYILQPNGEWHPTPQMLKEMEASQ